MSGTTRRKSSRKTNGKRSEQALSPARPRDGVGVGRGERRSELVQDKIVGGRDLKDGCSSHRVFLNVQRRTAAPDNPRAQPIFGLPGLRTTSGESDDQQVTKRSAESVPPEFKGSEGTRRRAALLQL